MFSSFVNCADVFLF